MTSFSSIERNYYTPAESTLWDRFVDAMTEQGYNPEDEDFDAWVEDETERAESDKAERDMEYAMEQRLFGD